MPAIDIRCYTDRYRAERACGKRSCGAFNKGQCSLFDLRELADGSFVGGYTGLLAALFPEAKIAGQWSGGYRVTSQNGNPVGEDC